MFSKLAIITSLAVLAVATPAPGGGSAPKCSTGPVQCCDSVQSASSSQVAKLLESVGISAGSVNVPVGVTCTPIAVGGTSSNSCSAQSVCCEDNNFNGVVAIGCSPININA